MYFCRTKTPYGHFLTAKNSLAFKLPLANLKGVSEIRNSFPLMAASRNPKGRPQLTAGKRIRKIDARFTEEEFKTVLEMEKKLGIRRTDLVRIRLLNDGTNLVINAKELISQLDGIGAEMARAGNNINQLAKHCNTVVKHQQLPSRVVNEFNELMAIYLKGEQEMYKIFRQMYRVMKKDAKP